ncbi:MAG: PAS domain-containing sensor histidine kinase [Rhodospirillales bacterium]|nr:PAS domain-containing sensor histidine kinase [Rhodospirillales bacterium]
MTAVPEQSGGQRLWRWFLLWSRRQGLTRKLTYLLAIAATVSGFATYGALTRSGPYGPDTDTVILLLNIDLVLLLLLGAVVGRRLLVLSSQRRRGMTGSKLQARLVAAFALAAIVPAILVGVSSVLFFTLGVEAWFSERVRTALEQSVEVAEAYTTEHAGNLRSHTSAMARDLDRAGPALLANEYNLSRMLEAQSALRELSEALVFRGDGRILGQTSLSFSLALALQPLPEDLLVRAGPDTVLMLTTETNDRVRALIELEGTPDTYLFVGRLVDPIVIGHTEQVSEAVSEFQDLEGQRSSLQIVFALVYVVSALLLLFVAMWFALQFASRIVQPVTALAGAAERVRAGDLTARVEGEGGADELASLSRAFNRMTGQLATQRHELIEANRQLDTRRRFTESVLSGVSAGVIGLDDNGIVELPNRRALSLLEVGYQDLVGAPLGEVVPELEPLLGTAMTSRDHGAAGNVELIRSGRVTNLMVRISLERGSNMTAVGADSEPAHTGYVVTFDDVTPLVAAQRKAAWGDVARRIAHEIKNPLTPIQLSAERLKRKYLAQIEDAPDVFEACTDTIVRQVGDLRHIVDEFSNFARLPSPEFHRENIVELVDQALTLQEVGGTYIAIKRDFPTESCFVSCDRRQIGQVLNNLIKNAVEAIGERNDAATDRRGLIRATVADEDGHCIICIEDNGRGLPEGPHEKLFEPYVTNRDKGTGLGLAIAQRIVEEHNGCLDLRNNPDGGACATIMLPLEIPGRGTATAGDGHDGA